MRHKYLRCRGFQLPSFGSGRSGGQILDFPILASVCILSWDVNRVAMFSKQLSMVVVRESSFVSGGCTDGSIVPAFRSLFVDVYHTSGVVVRDPLFALH